MKERVIVDDDELRELALEIAPDYFKSREVRRTLEKNCYGMIVGRIIKQPTEKSRAFLTYLLGPEKANMPHYEELIDLWARLKDIKLLDPETATTQLEHLEAHAKPIVESGKTLHIFSGDYIEIGYAKTTTHKLLHGYENVQPNDLNTLAIPLRITDEILRLKIQLPNVTKTHPTFYSHFAATSLSKMYATLNPEGNQRQKPFIDSELKLFEAGTWPIGVDSANKLHVYVPPENPQQ